MMRRVCLSCEHEIRPTEQSITCKGDNKEDGIRHTYHKICFIMFSRKLGITACLACRQWSGSPCCLCLDPEPTPASSSGESRVPTPILGLDHVPQPGEVDQHWQALHAYQVCEMCEAPYLTHNKQLHELLNCPESIEPCKWCHTTILKAYRDKHEILDCKGGRCAICQGFQGEKECESYRRCTHVLHADCLGDWATLFPKTCFLCFPFSRGYSFFHKRLHEAMQGSNLTSPPSDSESEEESEEEEEPQEGGREMVDCLLKCGVPRFKREREMYDHMVEAHLPKICKPCGMDYIPSSEEAHKAFCLKRDAICPSSGCKSRVPVSLIEESRVSANCLVEHHGCKHVLQCLFCNGFQRSEKKLKRHVNSHTPEEINRSSPSSLRPRRSAFKRARRDISAFATAVKELGIFDEEEE